MAYGPLAQCAFMSGPSPFKKKAPPGEEKKQFLGAQIGRGVMVSREDKDDPYLQAGVVEDKRM